MTVYADLLRYRELFANLFRRDFQAKYKGSLLGVFWSLLNPLVLLGVYLVVFGLLWKGGTLRHYPLYLLAGLACSTCCAGETRSHRRSTRSATRSGSAGRRGSRTSSTSSSRRRPRSCSARSSSAGSTTGLPSNSEHDPPVVEPRLLARRRVGGQAL